MTPERWQQVKAIFNGAVECSSASRMAYIRERCGDDEELRREVESLLASDAPTGSFLDNRFLETIASAFTSSETNQVLSQLGNDSFGPYVPVQVLGEGGMGAVYLARQLQPIRREVALKVVKFGMDSREVLGRFEIERQTLAMMDHPNVARVLDAGTSERGRSYFVMEYVEGVPITQYCDEKALTTRERLQLFVPVCNALQHAHQKGIIHRDVKPSNVLVAEIDGRPLPKVIDFGVARATEQCSLEREAFTLSGQLIGTPEYMSPEQASLNSHDIDTRTDVYSLGVLLYELLVGALPLDIRALRKMALGEVLRAIRETPAPRPTAKITEMGSAAEKLALQRSTNPVRLKRELAGDLDSIVMKAIDKDRRCRYASASEFAADIERSLRSEPVIAHPPDLRYRAGRFVRRHRGALRLVASAMASATLLLVCGTLFSLWQAAVADEHAVERRVALVRDVASGYVAQAINRTPHLPLREALRDPLLSEGFRRLETYSDELSEIAVVNPTGQILADSEDHRIGMYTPAYPDFDTVVRHSSWSERLKLLSGREKQRYQMEQPLGRAGEPPLVYVRVVVWPSLILSHTIWPEMRHSAENATLLFAGAIGLTLLVSAIAFRRFG